MKLQEFVTELKEITEKYKKLKKSLKEESSIVDIISNITSENKDYEHDVSLLIGKYKKDKRDIDYQKLKFIVNFYERDLVYGSNSEETKKDFVFLTGIQNF